MGDETRNRRRWIEQLSDEEAAFLRKFVLASGSLKDLAADYGITYPTVRLRLDRLIQKIKLLDSPEIPSEFERLLRIHYAEGKLDAATFKALLDAHKAEMEGPAHDKDRAASRPADLPGNAGN
jgi:hypothetical protein